MASSKFNYLGKTFQYRLDLRVLCFQARSSAAQIQRQGFDATKFRYKCQVFYPFSDACISSSWPTPQE